MLFYHQHLNKICIKQVPKDYMVVCLLLLAYIATIVTFIVRLLAYIATIVTFIVRLQITVYHIVSTHGTYFYELYNTSYIITKAIKGIDLTWQLGRQ